MASLDRLIFGPCNLDQIPRWKGTSEILGKGACGAVRAVIDQWRGQIVAAKTNHPNEHCFELVKEEQNNYQQLAYKVRHLNGFYGSYQNAPLQCTLIMELAPPTLADVLRERGPLPFKDVVSLTRQLLETHEDMVKIGWVHYDLKSDNLCFKNRKLTLLDLSHARPISEQQTEILEHSAPEICLGKKWDGSIDLWNIACIVYEAYMGTSPFSPGGLADIFDQLGYPSEEYLSGCTEIEDIFDIPLPSRTFWQWNLSEKGAKDQIPRKAVSLLITLLEGIFRYTDRISAQEGLKICQKIEAEHTKPSKSCLIS